MATGNGIDFEWFRYTANDATHFAVKCDKDWGANADSGLATYNAADPVWVASPRNRLRKVALQDTVSGRRTQRVAGTATAACLTPGATVTTVARGAGGTYTLTSLGEIPEKRPKTAVIISKAEPITT